MGEGHLHPHHTGPGQGDTWAALCTLPMGTGAPSTAGAAHPEGNCMRPSQVMDLRSDALITHRDRDMPREVGRELGVGARCPDVQPTIWAKNLSLLL